MRKIVSRARWPEFLNAGVGVCPSEWLLSVRASMVTGTKNRNPGRRNSSPWYLGAIGTTGMVSGPHLKHGYMALKPNAICKYVCTHTYVYIHCRYVYICKCMYICRHKCTYIYVYMDIYTYVYISAYHKAVRGNGSSAFVMHFSATMPWASARVPAAPMLIPWRYGACYLGSLKGLL